MRSCLTWLALREMQIKTANTYHCTPIEIAKIKKADTTKCWQECAATRALIYCWWEWKKMSITLENGLALSYKVKYMPTDWPFDSTPRYLPKGNGNMSTKRLEQECL